MKNVIVLFFLFNNSLFGNAQIDARPIAPTELKNCAIQYESLTFEGGPKEDSKTYFYKKKKHTGCAIHFVKSDDSYYAYNIVEGKLERMIATYGDGTLERDFRFKNGKSHGKHLMWFGNGKPYIEETYEAGKPIKLLQWYNNNQLAREAYFEKGKLKKEKTYDRDGRLMRK